MCPLPSSILCQLSHSSWAAVRGQIPQPLEPIFQHLELASFNFSIGLQEGTYLLQLKQGVHKSLVDMVLCHILETLFEPNLTLSLEKQVFLFIFFLFTVYSLNPKKRGYPCILHTFKKAFCFYFSHWFLNPKIMFLV